MQVKVTERVVCRFDYIGIAGNNNGCRLHQFKRGKSQVRRHQQDLRLDVDRLSVLVRLLCKRRNAGRQRGRCQGRACVKVCVSSVEQGNTVGHIAVGQKMCVDKVARFAAGLRAHRLGNGRDHPQVIVDDVLPGDAEVLCVRSNAVLLVLLFGRTVPDLAAVTYLFESPGIGKPRPGVRLEVRDRAYRAPLSPCGRYGIISL